MGAEKASSWALAVGIPAWLWAGCSASAPAPAAAFTEVDGGRAPCIFCSGPRCPSVRLGWSCFQTDSLTLEPFATFYNSYLVSLTLSLVKARPFLDWEPRPCLADTVSSITKCIWVSSCFLACPPSCPPACSAQPSHTPPPPPTAGAPRACHLPLASGRCGRGLRVLSTRPLHPVQSLACWRHSLMLRF